MEDNSKNNVLSEKQRIRKNNKLNNYCAILDKGKLRYITVGPACIALGTSLMTFITQGYLVGLIGFIICFLLAHSIYRSSWNNITKSVKILKNELMGK